MTRKFLNICLSQLNLWTKILLVLAIIIMSAAFAFIWRIHQGPIDLAFIKPQIESALSDPQQDLSVTIDKLSLTWPSLTDPLLLDLDGVQVHQKDTQNLSVENAALSLSGLGLLTGKILPTYILIERPILHLVQQDGQLRFLWQTPEKKEKIEKEAINKTATDEVKVNEGEMTPEKARSDVRSFLNELTKQENTRSLFTHLKEIEFKQAIIKAEDFQKENNDYLGIIDLKLEKNNLGLQGVLSAVLPGEDGSAAKLKSDVMYRLEQKDITFTADLENFNPAHLASFFDSDIILTQQDFTIDGKVQAAFDKNLSLQTALMNFTIPQGTANFPNAYDEPLSFKDIIFDAHLNRPENTLNIKRFEATVNGIAIKAAADGKIENNIISAPLILEISNLPLDKIPSIFPKTHLDSTSGQWFTQKLQKGRAHDIMIKTDLVLTKDQETNKNDITMANTRVDFKTEGVTVNYSKTLKPITEAKTTGFYDNDTLTINGTYAKIDGDIISTDIKLKITNLSVKGEGEAVITARAKGPLKTALTYLSDEPISIGKKMGFDIKKTEGIIDYTLNLQFPTIKNLPKERIKTVIDADITNIKLPKIVKGLDLTGGPYKLGYKDGAVSLKGSGALSGYPITLDWIQYFNSAGKDFNYKITTSITSDQKLRDIFNIGLEECIDGDLPLNIVYTDFGEKAVINVKGDLTPTLLHGEEVDYRKERGVEGNMSLRATLKNSTLQKIDNLFLKTNGFALSNGKLNFRELKDGHDDVVSGSFPNTTLGQTSANIDFEVTPDNILKAVITGNVIDLKPFLKSDKNKKTAQEREKKLERPMKISVSAQQLLGKNKESLSDSKIYLEIDKQGDINRLELDAKSGTGDMYIRFKPEEGTEKRTFRMESTDAGHTLKTLGLHKKVRGGTMKIYGIPQGRDLSGDLFGSARIDDFRVKSTPVLAKLLGAMSLNGVNDLLSNDGVSFARLEAEFEWQFRDTGNFLVIKEGRTSGSSLGLTFDGSVDQMANEINLKGTIVPVSGINKVIGNIPLIGDILTGGDALIAATYNVSGPTSDPKVSVNPLSVLAPGFLRKILFEGGSTKPPTTQE